MRFCCCNRYPSGESYRDVIARLETVIIELERERECVCVVAHQAILRALYGYFTDTPLHVSCSFQSSIYAILKGGGTRNANTLCCSSSLGSAVAKLFA